VRAYFASSDVDVLSSLLPASMMCAIWWVSWLCFLCTTECLCVDVLLPLFLDSYLKLYMCVACLGVVDSYLMADFCWAVHWCWYCSQNWVLMYVLLCCYCTILVRQHTRRNMCHVWRASDMFGCECCVMWQCVCFMPTWCKLYPLCVSVCGSCMHCKLQILVKYI